MLNNSYIMMLEGAGMGATSEDGADSAESSAVAISSTSDFSTLTGDQSITVVVATLGGPTLGKTIETLNQGSVIPSEILICIPERESERVIPLQAGNVKIIVTPCRGQVAQRAYGFHHASYPFVMQIDDDIEVDRECLANLRKTIQEQGPNPKVAVAPALIDRATGKSAYQKPNRNKLLQYLYYWFMNGAAGYEPGKIDKSGAPVGIDTDSVDRDLVEVEWLAGGCVMHYRENIILSNFFPFSGKAFCEDIIHSHHLMRNGVRMIVNTRAICRLELAYSSTLEIGDFFKNLYADFRARRHFMRISSRSCGRMYLFYMVSILSYMSKKIMSFCSKKLKSKNSFI